MRGLGVFCFLGLFSFSAMASEYVRFSDLKKDLQAQWNTQAEATIPLNFTFESPTTKAIPNTAPVGICSAVLVGPHGEALSNLHCFESCLYNNNITTTQKIEGTPLNLIEVKSGTLPVTCDIKIDTKAPIKIKQAQILKVFGPGWVSDRNILNEFMNAEPEKYLSLVNSGLEGGGDLVLIRLPVENKPCISLGDENFNDIKPIDVVSLSYPIVYRKKANSGYIAETFFTMGFSLLWSTGQASSNEATLTPYLSQDLVSNLDLITPTGLLLTSTDTEPGASGSPLFNQNGHLVGITRSTWKWLSMDYVPWTSGAIDLAPCKKWLQENIKDINLCL